MGIASRLKPVRLAEKLLQIRMSFDLSQNEMIGRLGLADELIREELSAFERGLRQPPLVVLLRYARCVGVSTDVLIDDQIKLPERLLKASKQGIVRSKSISRSKRKQ
jgi:transcriptional regulator with XRE-family HTH domain